MDCPELEEEEEPSSGKEESDSSETSGDGIYDSDGEKIAGRELLSDTEDQGDWTLQTDEALQRTQNNVTELYRDEWTAVAESPVAGHGLFAMTELPAGLVLYAYTGTTKTAEQASRRPNAYQLDLQGGLVCDAGSTHAASPARWVNTQPFDRRCNCEYQEHQGKLYLITLRRIPAMREVFASYGEGKTPYADWPEGFLGDGQQEVSEYRDYLLTAPHDATSEQLVHAKKLLLYLREDLEAEGLDQDLKAATPFLELMSEFVTRCDTRRLSVLLNKVLTKYDLDLKSYQEAETNHLAAIQAAQQDARSKLSSLVACKAVQGKCIKAISAMHNAVKHLHNVQEARQAMNIA